MGNGSSISTSNPFPVSEKTLTNLGRLTYGTSRILNTEDIYNLFNLNVQGPCGNYVIFKKKNIGIKLLPFIADISGAQEFLYQDSLKSVSTEMRKEVCKELSYTMLRTISTIVACLASIQYDHPQVKALLGKVPKPNPAQRGGSASTIKDWLVRHNVIKQHYEEVYSLNDKPTLLLTFTNAKEFSVEATLTDATAKTIRLIFLEPVVVEAPERGVAVCISDMERILACGILYNDEYLPFDLSKRRRSFGDFCQNLMTSPIHTEPATSYRLFLMIHKLIEENNDKAVAELLQQYFSATGSTGGLGSLGSLGSLGLGNRGLGLGLGNRGLGLGLGNRGLGSQGLNRGLGLGLGLGLGNQVAARSLQAVLGRQPLSSSFPFANIGANTSGPIRGPAQKYIHDYFEKCRKMLATEESPAARRARTVVAGDDNRKARTDICRDPYWQKTNLSEIYPWATLQFMCVEDWNSLGTPDVKLGSDFVGFLSNLKGLYTGGNLPTLVSKSKSNRLEDLHFSGVSSMPLCRSGKETFNIKDVQDLLVKMNQLYTNHVTAMSAIINSLIIEIDDQGTNVYRLHPQIFKSGQPTAMFINEKAREARTKLIAFYTQVETIYIEIIKRLG